MLHPAQLVQPRPGPGYVYKTGRAARVPQTGDDLASYYATEGLRKKQRERDGCGARSKRPSSADAIGVSGSKEFRKLKSATSRARPGSAASSRLRKSTLETSPAKPAKPDKMFTVARGKPPKTVPGVICHDRDFAWTIGRRTRPGSSIRETIDSQKKPHEAETEHMVERVLEQVKEDYFPISLLSRLRDKTAEPPPPTQQFRRVPSGSGLITTGQHAKYQQRTAALLGQVTRLNRQVRLRSSQLERIERQFVALSANPSGNQESNPVITFSRFVEVMDAVGVGKKLTEADFLKRFYKIMDRNGDKSVDFGELLDGLAILLGGSAKQKLQLFYVMYAYHDPQMIGRHYFDDKEQAELALGLSMFNIYRVLMAVLKHYCGVEEDDGEDHRSAADDDAKAQALEVFKRKQEDFKKFHNSLDCDGDGRVTFEELWKKFAEEPELVSCIEEEGKKGKRKAKGGEESLLDSSAASASSGGGPARARRRRRRKTLRFKREGLDMHLGPMDKSESSPRSKRLAARRAAKQAREAGKVGVISPDSPTRKSAVETETARRSLARRLAGAIDEGAAKVEASKTVQLAGAMEEAVHRAEEALAEGVEWHWHYGDQWVNYDEVTQRSLETAFQAGLPKLVLSASVCEIGSHFRDPPEHDGRYEVTLQHEETHTDLLPEDCPLWRGGLKTQDWAGMSQFNSKSHHRRPIRRVRKVDLGGASTPRMQAMVDVVMTTAEQEPSGDPYPKTETVGQNVEVEELSPWEVTEAGKAQLGKYELRATLDHLGITHSDLEVLNAFTRVQPDAAQLYPVLGVLRAVRQKRRDVAEKAKNIALSQQRGKGSGRKLRAGGKSPKGKRKSPKSAPGRPTLMGVESEPQEGGPGANVDRVDKNARPA